MKFHLPEPEFKFAGFTFPKWLWTLPEGVSGPPGLVKGSSRRKLLEERLQARKSSVCGPYYHSPKPGAQGQSSYELPMRWKYCDEVEGVRINHTGWFCDEFQDSKIRGVVVRLPKKRGFIVGWTMGEGMSCSVDSSYIYKDEQSAAHAADSMAEHDAEREQEFQREEIGRLDAETLAEAERNKQLEPVIAYADASPYNHIPGADQAIDAFEHALTKLRNLGIVATIHTRPLKPLAAGHYYLVIDYRLNHKLMREAK